MPNMSRLFVSGKALLEGQLSEGKKERMGVEGKLGVKMVDGEGGVWDLDFMHWTSVDKYVFSNQSIRFVEEFGVVEGRVLQIWCFRDRLSALLCVQCHGGLNYVLKDCVESIDWLI